MFSAERCDSSANVAKTWGRARFSGFIRRARDLGVHVAVLSHPASSRARVAAAVILLAMGAAVALVSALNAYSRPFWHDEIYTAIISDLPDASAVWPALTDAVDANPPLYYYLARSARFLVPDDHLAYRLPSIVGFLLAMGCIYAVLAGRVDRLSALAASSLLLALPVSDYAFEARPYTLMLAGVCFALFAWQRVDDGPVYAWLLGLALATALSLHYYAALVWPAFAAAEVAWWYQHGRPRFSVWAALLLGATPLLAFRGHLDTIREYYGVNLWSPPSVLQVISGPDWLFGVRHDGFIFALGVAVWLMFRIGSLRHHRAVSAAPHETVRRADLLGVGVLSLGLLAVPAVGVAVAMTMGGDLTPRYMLTALAGGAIGLGIVLSGAPPTARWFVLAATVAAYTARAIHLAPEVATGRLNDRRTGFARSLEHVIDLHNASASLPVVVSDAHQYLPLTRYGSPELQRSLFALVDPPAAVQYVRTDAIGRNLQALRRYVPLRIVDFADFAAKHRTFLLVSSGGPFDWWPARLADDGHELVLLADAGAGQIYRVVLNGGSGTS
jgi:Dolichyl-phosphate-mannose-protein mannosyltransferase